MKKLLTLLFSTLIVVSCFFMNVNEVKADYPLDYINNYDIEIVPNEDGTLNMTYHLNWTVLDDEEEGPLNWVKIGVWNSQVHNLTALSENITSIESDSEYIRIYLDRDYHKGETVDFTFSFVQKYAFYMDNGYVEYGFKPGWFEDIQVENCTVRWKAKAKDYYYTNSDKADGDYLIWQRSLDYDETFEVQVKYEPGYFYNLDATQDYKVYKRGQTIKIALIITAGLSGFVALFLLLAYLIREESDGYDYYCGFSGRHWMYHRYHPMHSPGVSRSGKTVKTYTAVEASKGGSGYTGGGGHSCACACACAGGGRAGCSMKDFYNTNLKLSYLRKR